MSEKNSGGKSSTVLRGGSAVLPTERIRKPEGSLLVGSGRTMETDRLLQERETSVNVGTSRLALVRIEVLL